MVSPDLGGVTGRYSEAWLRNWLKDPQAVRPGTSMPTFGFSDDEIDALISYLKIIPEDCGVRGLGPGGHGPRSLDPGEDEVDPVAEEPRGRRKRSPCSSIRRGSARLGRRRPGAHQRAASPDSDSRPPHIHNGHVYAPAKAVAEALGVEWSYDAAANRVTMGGKPIAYNWEPAPHTHENDVLFVPVRAVADALGYGVSWNEAAQLVLMQLRPEGMPADAIPISPVVPGMGEHWANPRNLPVGPIYGVYKGKVVFLEYMLSQEDLKAGKSWTNLAADPSLPPVHHVEVEFVPNGHEGYEIPHYDVHLYLVPHEEHVKYMP